MNYEIERKFLVDLAIAGPVLCTESIAIDEIEQVYLVDSPDCELRIRLRSGVFPPNKAGIIHATLTAKGSRAGATRPEPESALDPQAAQDMISLAPWPRLRKLRHTLPAGGNLVWEVDLYRDGGRQFAVAEIELPSEDHEFARPSWLGREVTGETEWENRSIAKRLAHGGEA